MDSFCSVVNRRVDQGNRYDVEELSQRQHQLVVNLSRSIRDGESVRHYTIRKLDNGGYFIAARAPFSNLNDLVAHYMEESDGLNCKLTMASPSMSFALRVFFIHVVSTENPFS